MPPLCVSVNYWKKSSRWKTVEDITWHQLQQKSMERHCFAANTHENKLPAHWWPGDGFGCGLHKYFVYVQRKRFSTLFSYLLPIYKYISNIVVSNQLELIWLFPLNLRRPNFLLYDLRFSLVSSELQRIGAEAKYISYDFNFLKFLILHLYVLFCK